MKNVCRELIYFDPKLKGKENFSGEFSPVDTDKRIEYLSKYAEFLKDSYGLSSLPKKAVEDEEIPLLVNKYGYLDLLKSGCNFDRMDAYVKKVSSPYLGWQFYTFGTSVLDKTITFTDGITPPVPAAKYEFNASDDLKEIEFSFCPINLGTLPSRVAVNGIGGRTFELRSTIHTVVKIHLLTDGNLYYVDGSNYKTHPKFYFLATCKENEWTTVRLRLKDNSCDVFIGEKEVLANCKIYDNLAPDNFFVSGGMHPFGEWKLRLNSIEFKDKTVTDFFLPNSLEENEEYLGEVKLPFAIGAYKNKDKALIFRKKFDLELKSNVKLHINSIDPCGFVYLNGKLIDRVDNFLGVDLDISSAAKEKDNLLEVVVMPRAPEVFYQWHKHSDPYNGWFFRGCYIESYDNAYIEDVYLTTDQIKDGSVLATLSFSAIGSGVAEIHLEKIYPEKGERVKIDTISFDGGLELEKQYDLSVDLWDTDNPNLYSVTVCVDDGYSKSIETGFRIIEQKDGEIHLNGKRVFLNGALSMQFLPPHDLTPVNHLCPTSEQIVMQLEQVKRMNGNTMRMHFLGYGSNDERYARFASRMGVMLVWTTRLIDTVESVLVYGEWRASNEYLAQIKEVRNHPSIIMWEGSNEAKGRLKEIDIIHDEFVSKVKTVDKTRLLCPVSHLYYAGGLYDMNTTEVGEYYQDDGLKNHDMKPQKSSFGWTDKNVVRSAHTYQIALGYGCEWEWFANQEWASQDGYLKSKEHAYLVTEYAVIGRACPLVKEAKDYFLAESYEMVDEEAALGCYLSPDKYEISQAHQALCALYVNKKMRIKDVDGMFWCCLQSGANDGSYLKPVLDFYGYKKFAYDILGDYYKKNYCTIDSNGPFWNKNSRIRPVLLAENGDYKVTVKVQDEHDKTVYEKNYQVTASSWVTFLPECDFEFKSAGYYKIITEIEKER